MQEGISLLGLLVKGMLTDFGDDMHCQFLEIIYSLLDSYTLSGAQRDTIIEIFYEKHLGQLIDVIVASCPANGPGQSVEKSVVAGEAIANQKHVKPEILSNISELLCFCVLHHPYRIKCNFILNNVIDKVLLLTQRKEKYLVVSAVRFARTILSRHDEHLVNHIVKNNLLKPVIDAFISNGSRYNLLNSAVLELFEFIRKENLKLLIRYIVDSFWNQLVKFESLGSIHSLKVKYEQCLENVGTKDNVNASDLRRRTDDRALEKEEEDYFNEDSDEGTASEARSQQLRPQAPAPSSNGVAESLSRKSGGLVDYEDDEDDEDYRPPKKLPKTSDDDEGALDALRLRCRLASTKDKEFEVIKKQRFGKNSKPRENSVFAALCSTLSQTVLPSKKTASRSSVEANHQETEPATRPDDKNYINEELNSSRGCSDSVDDNLPENGQLSGEDSSLIKSLPEMAVNGG